MAEQTGFQEQIKRLSELVTQFEQMPDGPAKGAGKELVQLLMEVHSQGLERMMEIAFESSAGGDALIERLGKDDVVGGLLLLYWLHPEALETRVQMALERMRARLRKLSCAVELVGIEEGAVHVRVAQAGHSCGSSAGELKAIIESGIYELAPDVSGLEILGLEAKHPSGFVALESLVGAGTSGVRSGATDQLNSDPR